MPDRCPPGPVSAEALKFTLVKPLAGARTTTGCQPVSPRALDSAIKETVPAASVISTRSDSVIPKQETPED